MILLILAAAGVASVSADCDVYGFQNCMVPFAQYNTEAQVGITWTEQKLVEVCGVFASVSACARPKISSCGSETLGVWDSVDDGFNYLCTNPGKATYLEHQTCFAKSTLNNKLKMCNRTLAAESQAAAQGARSQILERTCRAINKFVSCTVSYTKEGCGEVAADFQLTLVSKLMDGTLDLISCSLSVTVDNASVNGGANGAITARGGSLAGMLGLALLLLTLFKRQ